MKISFSEPLSESVSSDKWNSWVYRASFNGWLDGQQTYKSTNLNGNISASRVTADWKINLSGRYNYRIQKFVVSDETITSNNNSKSLNSLVVRSISDHWSYGGSIYLGSSSYSNTNFSGSFLPGIEYDLFPYSQSTRKQLRLLYSLDTNTQITLIHHLQYDQRGSSDAFIQCGLCGCTKVGFHQPEHELQQLHARLVQE